jgi:hypothetical protein
LKWLKSEFDPSQTFLDNDYMKDDQDLKDCMKLGNEDGIPESVKFSCKINLKGTSALNQYQKISFVVTNKKIYSARKKKIKPLI